MKIFRMMIAMLGISLAIGSGVSARKAGAGARAGLPDIYKELSLNAESSGDDIAEAITAALGKAFLNKDRNKARKLKGMLQVFLQRRPFWQNLGLERADRNDPEAVAQAYVGVFGRLAVMLKTKSPLGEFSGEEAIAMNKALDTASAIVAKEAREHLDEWLRVNPGAKTAFLKAAGANSISDLNIKTASGDDEQETIILQDDDVNYENLNF